MPVIPFAIQWSIPENRLIPLKDSINGRLNTALVSKIPGFKYYLSIFPNGNDDVRLGEVWIGLHIKLGYVKKVVPYFTISIESANYSFEGQFINEESTGWGSHIADTKEFFNPEKKCIVDGKCTIKINGIFKFETSNAPTSGQQKWDGVELGNGLWKENGDKDFTIIVDGKEIKVHKLVLQIQSDVLRAMFNPKTKESIENTVEITDLTFDVVETAVKMIYNCNFVTSLSADQMMSLLQFFDKYNIPSLKNKVEYLLIIQISAATVCRIANASIISNSINLKNKCIEFMEKSFASKTPLSDIEILDNDIAVKVLQNLVYYTAEIQ